MNSTEQYTENSILSFCEILLFLLSSKTKYFVLKIYIMKEYNIGYV
jgi:hypothetical protein